MKVEESREVEISVVQKVHEASKEMNLVGDSISGAQQCLAP